MPTFDHITHDTVDTYVKSTKTLFKSFLIMLEDLHIDHNIHFDKLKDSIPSEYHSLIDQADYLDKDKMQYLRKKVLDVGNSSIRNINLKLEEFNVEFKF